LASAGLELTSPPRNGDVGAGAHERRSAVSAARRQAVGLLEMAAEMGLVGKPVAAAMLASGAAPDERAGAALEQGRRASYSPGAK